MKTVVFAFLFFPPFLFAQGQGDTWCFGKSAQIKFNGGNPQPNGTSLIYSQEECTSISDQSGDLLFYVGPNYFHSNGWGMNTLTIWNKNNQIMQNGDSLFGNTSTTNGVLALPLPYNTSKYLVLSINPGPFFQGLYCSIVDMSLNFGLGSVILRDSVIINGYLSEKLTAVRHANGNDWWVLVHKIVLNDSSDVFYRLLIDSSGFGVVDTQSIGSYYGSPSNYYRGVTGEMTFSEDGSKLVTVGYGLIDLFDFSRCTGELANWVNLSVANPTYPDDYFYGASFSQNGLRLYVSSIAPNLGPTNQYLYQFDLLSANILASRTLIHQFFIPLFGLGQHQIGPNGKIYIATGFDAFPSQHDTIYNQNLSVINYPDSLGLSCDLQLFSVPIGLGTSYVGLPNIPNYNLGTLELNCDSLNSINENNISENLILIVPNPSSGNLSLIFTCSMTSMYSFEIFNLEGTLIANKSGKAIIGKNSYSIDMSVNPPGIYFAHFIMENKQQIVKIILF